MQIASRQIAISLHKTKLVLLNFTCLKVKYLLETSQCLTPFCALLASSTARIGMNWHLEETVCLSICLCFPWLGLGWVAFPSPSPQSPQAYLNEVSTGELHVSSSFLVIYFMGKHYTFLSYSDFSYFSILSYRCQKHITVVKASNFFYIIHWNKASNIVRIVNESLIPL